MYCHRFVWLPLNFAASRSKAMVTSSNQWTTHTQRSNIDLDNEEIRKAGTAQCRALLRKLMENALEWVKHLKFQYTGEIRGIGHNGLGGGRDVSGRGCEFKSWTEQKIEKKKDKMGSIRILLSHGTLWWAQSYKLFQEVLQTPGGIFIIRWGTWRDRNVNISK